MPPVSAMDTSPEIVLSVGAEFPRAWMMALLPPVSRTFLLSTFDTLFSHNIAPPKVPSTVIVLVESPKVVDPSRLKMPSLILTSANLGSTMVFDIMIWLLPTLVRLQEFPWVLSVDDPAVPRNFQRPVKSLGKPGVVEFVAEVPPMAASPVSVRFTTSY